MIDYAKIAEAIRYYHNLGFMYVDVPWVIPKIYTDITKPPYGADFPIEATWSGNRRSMMGMFVSSGEQSFLCEIDKGRLQKSKWCCVTPCLRHEKLDDLNEGTRRYFIKAELIDTQNPDIKNLHRIIDDCMGFFSKYVSCKKIETEEGFDIVTSTKEIELGSYGIRSFLGTSWIFATGCAEPRLSYAVRQESI